MKDQLTEALTKINESGAEEAAELILDAVRSAARPVVEVRLKKMHESAQLPKHEHESDAGADVRYCASLGTIMHRNVDILTDNTLRIRPGGTALVHSGLQLAHLDEGYEIQVRPRSGQAAKKDLTVLNSPGTIDSGYRNAIGIILHNAGSEPIVIEDSERIAQLVIKAQPSSRYSWDDKVTETDRDGGFGSTGLQ